MAIFTIRPVGDAYIGAWKGMPGNVSSGSGTLYTFIDEEVADNDTTYITIDGSALIQDGLFMMSQLPEVINISKISLFIRHSGAVKTGVQIGQTRYWGTENNPGGYEAFSRDIPTNPATGQAWTRADINGMTAGFQSGSKAPKVTQFYIEVTGDPPSTPAVINVDGAIKQIGKIQANIGGAIKNAIKIQANIGGTIKTVWP